MHGELVAALLAYRATRKGKDGKERSVLVNTRTHKPDDAQRCRCLVAGLLREAPWVDWI